MDKETFLTGLEERLIVLDITPEYREQYLHQFERYLNALADEEEIKRQLSDADLDAIAHEIAQAVTASQNREAKQSMEAENESGIPADLSPDQYIPSDDDYLTTEQKFLPEDEIADTIDAPIAAHIQEVASEELASDFENTYLDVAIAVKEPEETPLYAEDPLPYDAYFDEAKAPITPQYIGVVALTSPIALTLYLSIFAIFFSGSLALIALIAAFSLTVIAAACVGSIVTLFGVIYGISQFAQSSAICFYEIGLGLIAAGITLLVGILLYETGLRFLPYVLQQFRKLLSFVLWQIRRLYQYLRKECAER